jgi:cell division protease FtsH
LQLGQRSGEVFLGKDVGHHDTNNYSDEVAAAVDAEVRRLVEEAHAEAREILLLHRVTLDQLAEALVAQETLGDDDLVKIFGHLDSWESTGPAVSGERAAAAGRGTAHDVTGAGAGSGNAPGGFGTRREGYTTAEGEGPEGPDPNPPRF